MDGIGRIRESGGEKMVGCFVQPTLVRAVPTANRHGGDLRADSVRNRVDDLDPTIHWHNDGPQGLLSSIFRSSLGREQLQDRERISGRAGRRSAGKERRAAGASREGTRGKLTCGGRPIRPTGRRNCRLRRESSS
jgi:hypothetical protein